MTDWRTRAACRNIVDWPLRDSTAVRPFSDERDAMTVCEDCPVRVECDAFACAMRPPLGVWGGRVWRMVNRGGYYGAPLDREAANA